jgi:hypothetical protein
VRGQQQQGYNDDPAKEVDGVILATTPPKPPFYAMISARTAAIRIGFSSELAA